MFPIAAGWVGWLMQVVTFVEKLSFITAGHRAPNGAELLFATGLPALSNHLLETFDCIIIDSAPVNAASDAVHPPMSTKSSWSYGPAKPRAKPSCVASCSLKKPKPQ